MHSVEVALLPELVPRLLRLGGDEPRLVELLQQQVLVVGEVLVACVDVRNHRQVRVPKALTLLQLVPLGLKRLQGTLHVVLHQEVPEEIVDDLRPVRDLGHGGARARVWDIRRRPHLGNQPVNIIQRLLIVIQLLVVGELLVLEVLIAFLAELKRLQDLVSLLVFGAAAGRLCGAGGRRRHWRKPVPPLQGFCRGAQRDNDGGTSAAHRGSGGLACRQPLDKTT
mmetsp:Transcript_98008/g.277190  ORF Transcript_98008/g.277190 Transcript_98008/m.277190 type:complete len:224 (+) Transcript_98008:1370-2041(+)